MIYLLHFDRSYRHARHYLGYTENLERRIAEHRAGQGSPLVAAAVADGIGFVVAATWPGDRIAERRLHRYKNSRVRLCPICRANPDTDLAATSTTLDASDRRQPVAVQQLGEPSTPAAICTQVRRSGQSPGSGAHCRLEPVAVNRHVAKTRLLGSEIGWELVQR